ncbi:MAG: tetratricopeptide repeat protein [Salinivirgaceae bacterium]|jgi:Ca-activated chloride channel family protein|nr:tetratricopeptide repeat protein [Salinivirgaceae bacterium]
MKSKTIHILILFALILFVNAGWAQKERKYIRSGNDYYSEAIDDSLNVDSTLMKKAEEEYRLAIEATPSTYEGRNNLGNSLYRQKQYKEAINEWKALTGLNLSEKEKAGVYHNIGNANLVSNQLEKSIEAYKNALRLYPGDTATKYNLAFAQSKLSKQQQQQQKQDKNQDQNQDKNQDQQKKEEQQNQQEQQEQNQQQQEQQKQEQQQSQEQNAEEQKAQPGEEKQDGEEISKQDALRILQTLENDEKKLQEKLKRKRNKKSKSTKTEKDW